MKVETQDLPDNEVALSMEIEDERLEHAMETAYRHLAGRVNIAGFRRGKAPRSLVERVVGREALLEEALEHLLPEVYQEALETSGVKALTDPEFDVESMTPLKAKATVVVRPPVELGDYQSIKKDPPSTDVESSEVDSVLQQLREEHAEWVPAERASAFGDRVAIDVVGTVEDRQAINGEDIEYLVEEDNPSPVPGFAAQLVGMSAGDVKDFQLAVPEDAESAYAGQTMAFHVAVKDVKAKELPALDDDFATTVGSFKDLAELRTQLTTQLQERAQVTSRLTHEADVLSEAVEGATIALPDKLVNHQAGRLRDRMARELDTRGLTIEQYQRIRHQSDEELEAEFRSDAERSLKRSFVLQTIAEREGLVVPEERVDASIRDAFSADGGGNRAAERALRQGPVRERVRSSLIEEEAAKWLVEHAKGPEPTDAAQDEAGSAASEQEPESPAPESQEQQQ